MGFRPLKQYPTQDLKRAVVANAWGTGAGTNATMHIGDAVQPGATGHNDYVTYATTSGLVTGVILSLIQAGKVNERNSVTASNTAYGSTSNPDLLSNDNETYKIWSVDYLPTYVPMEYEVSIDAAAGTTTNSGGLCFLSIVSGNSGVLDESSVALFGGTAGQFWSYGVTSYSTTKVIGHFYKIL